METMYLTDLIDPKVLQRIQDAFSNMVGMAALTTDATGTPVTEGSNFTEYCMKYTRQSKVGCARCEECDRFGAVKTQESGKPTSYFCHSGLIDFAAPIMADGVMVGSFIGGQVLTERPDPEKIRQVAREIGVDFDEYWEALQKVQIIPEERIRSATEFLFTIAEVMSDMALGKHRAIEANIEIECAAKMKTDFLANMSHEIRTPMNAVIGMAEMALRDNLPETSKSYVSQIRSSGRALLTIINDILDFSKIESGKLDITPVEYEPMSLLNDVINIIMTRVSEKDISLILDVDPDLPYLLMGDNLRIRQILINLANNAVKFTNEGRIRITTDIEPVDDETIELIVSIEDTGIGIKKDNLDKIFESFQQVDSKRNRNVEGTGLGLAISKMLLELMGGGLNVESDYGKGSTFSFHLPQKIVDPTPSMIVREPEKCVALCVFTNPYLVDAFVSDTQKLGVPAVAVSSHKNMDKAYQNVREKTPDRTLFLFMENEQLTPQMEYYIKTHPDVVAVLATDFFMEVNLSPKNLLIVKKPLSTMNMSMIFNREDVSFGRLNEADDGTDFSAPTANVLIVDDNAVNLTVAEGLLEPLQMKITTAMSGKSAIAKIKEKRFDLVFMDHMMPEMDGIETTRIIRKEIPECSNMPIIALTANAVNSARDMFLSEGFNDFVAKPIEVRFLLSCVRKWLPESKIHKLTESDKAKAKTTPEESIEIGDLNVDEAIQLLGGQKLFYSVLKEYYKVIEKKADLIEQLYETEDWKNYTIEVHALKSASRQIGATALADRAMELEKAGNELNLDYIHENTAWIIEKYRSYLPVLAPHFEEEKSDQNEEKESANANQILKLIEDMHSALEDLDMDEMEEVCTAFSQYQYPEEQQQLLERLIQASDELDIDTCEEVLNEWENLF